MSTTDLIDRVVAALADLRSPPGAENLLQASIERRLIERRISYSREKHIRATERPDFLVTGDAVGWPVGIEVKVKGSALDLLHQARRYLDGDLLDGLVIVTRRSAHKSLPDTFNGKPVRVVHLVQDSF